MRRVEDWTFKEFFRGSGANIWFLRTIVRAHRKHHLIETPPLGAYQV